MLSVWSNVLGPVVIMPFVLYVLWRNRKVYWQQKMRTQ